MGKEDFRGNFGDVNTPSPEKISPVNAYARNISNYLETEQRDGILRPHQLAVFQDIERFFQEGHTRGYIDLPTGTGKTVLFVELSKALLSTDPEQPAPKILVVTPTKDLIYQTVGSKGEKGYGKFAPNLSIGTYFSDTPYNEKKQEYLAGNDVTVTTYRSFSTLDTEPVYRPVSDDDHESLARGFKNVRTDKKLLETFDVIILDEAHHALSDETSSIVKSLPQDKILIGFTATPDSGLLKRMGSVLPDKIHSLDLKEAIGMNLLSPLVPIGIHSGMKIKGTDLYDPSGEFRDSKISFLAQDPHRNGLIIDTAKVFTQNNIGTIISCIAGDQALHARYLAKELVKQGVNAEAVHNGIPSKIRQQIYEKFELGEIDVLTFVGVLGEGWDSNRAKALIAARPTRSEIFSKQRLGRVTRPGGIAFAVDIIDEFGSDNPAISIADVLDGGDIQFGKFEGTIGDVAMVEHILGRLQERVPVIQRLESKFTEKQHDLQSLEVIIDGALYSHDVTLKREWVTAGRISTSYAGVTDEVLSKIESVYNLELPKKIARQGSMVRKVYRVNEAKNVVYNLPDVNPSRYYTDENGIKRISPEGLVKLFSKRYPSLNEVTLNTILNTTETDIDWIPGKYLSSENINYRKYSVVKMFDASSPSIEAINQLISEYYARRTERTTLP